MNTTYAFWKAKWESHACPEYMEYDKDTWAELKRKYGLREMQEGVLLHVIELYSTNGDIACDSSGALLLTPQDDEFTYQLFLDGVAMEKKRG